MSLVKGYSKLSKDQKLDWLVKNYFHDDHRIKEEFKAYWHRDDKVQARYDEFSENTLTNFYMPYGIAPNFLINGKDYALPMVIEESSVVAAMANTGKFWYDKGGFHTQIISVEKVGQVHFLYFGDSAYLKLKFPELKSFLLENGAYLSVNMDARGGGVLDIELVDFSEKEEGYFQLKASFDTCDSMGANYINTMLEEYATLLQDYICVERGFDDTIQIIMSIVSNYTPKSIVRAWVECPIEKLGDVAGFTAEQFAKKIKLAVRIAEIDPHRATTHNKGIYNGIDALIIATGNDFRAVEACGHTYAAKSGHYTSLTHCSLADGIFKFWIDLPMAIGTVGGLTQLHPLVKRSLEILGNPDARTLMEIVACAGLAQNFAALKALTTVGIQQGHMKMHLLNILNHLEATEEERHFALEYFKDKVVSYTTTRVMLEQYRSSKKTV